MPMNRGRRFSDKELVEAHKAEAAKLRAKNPGITTREIAEWIREHMSYYDNGKLRSYKE